VIEIDLISETNKINKKAMVNKRIKVDNKTKANKKHICTVAMLNKTTQPIGDNNQGAGLSSTTLVWRN